MNQSIASLRAAYHDKQLAKRDYIDAMYAHHAGLFAYQRQLVGPGIREISMSADGVWMRFRHPDIRMGCVEGDARMAPLEAFNFGGFEPEAYELVSTIVSQECAKPGVSFLDIGANAGFYSLGLRSQFPALLILAFEPVPATFTILERNLALNGFTDIKTYKIGFSDRTQSVEFFTYQQHSGASSSVRLLDDVEPTRVTCQLVRLDEFRQSHPLRVGFIKCDVEGGELSVFRGAENLLREDRPVVFAEMLRKWCDRFNYHPNDIIRLMTGVGYHCFAVNPEGLAPCLSVTEKTAATNFLFLDPTRHARYIPTECKG